MKIIILNYSQGCVDVVGVPYFKGIQTGDIEEKLSEMGYKSSQISWMASDPEGTPVFYDTDECPTFTL